MCVPAPFCSVLLLQTMMDVVDQVFFAASRSTNLTALKESAALGESTMHKMANVVSRAQVLLFFFFFLTLLLLHLLLLFLRFFFVLL